MGGAHSRVDAALWCHTAVLRAASVHRAAATDTDGVGSGAQLEDEEREVREQDDNDFLPAVS